MIEAVLMFGLLTMVGEIILLSIIPPRARLRVLGSEWMRTLFHFGFAALNLWIHWGTITGSMTAVVAFIGSTITLRLGRWWWGEIRHGVRLPGVFE